MTTTARAFTRSKAEKVGEVERVYRTLREWLVSARLAPGDFLSEADLAARCRTSRTPVREACTRLMQDKWLSSIRRKGFQVTPISVRDIVEMYEFRKVLEGFTTEKVAQAGSREQVEELKKIVLPERDPQSDLPKILRSNQTFHLTLAQFAGNQRVTNQLNLILGYVSRLDTLCTQTVPGWIGHADILRAIEAREPGEAQTAMRLHIDLSRDKMIKLFST